MLAHKCNTAIGVGNKNMVLQLHKSQQQILNPSGAFPALDSHKRLPLVSNYGNLHSVSPSVEEDSSTDILKSAFHIVEHYLKGPQLQMNGHNNV